MIHSFPRKLHRILTCRAKIDGRSSREWHSSRHREPRASNRAGVLDDQGIHRFTMSIMTGPWRLQPASDIQRDSCQQFPAERRSSDRLASRVIIGAELADYMSVCVANGVSPPQLVMHDQHLIWTWGVMTCPSDRDPLR